VVLLYGVATATPVFSESATENGTPRGLQLTSQEYACTGERAHQLVPDMPDLSCKEASHDLPCDHGGTDNGRHSAIYGSSVRSQD